MIRLNRAALKAEAKASLQPKWGKAVGITAIYLIVSYIFAAPAASSFTRGMRDASSRSLYSSAYSDGVYSYSYANAPATSSNPSQYLAIFVTLFAMIFAVIMLHMFDGTDKSFGKELISPFTDGKAGATLINWLLAYIFTALWLLLLVIPGIVKSYAYSMSYYITDDWARQGYKVKSTEAINASKEMMKGHKGELFLLDLSFIGWYFIVLITFGLAGLYVRPYHQATRAAYYRNLAALQAQQGQYGQPAQGQPAQQYSQQNLQAAYGQPVAQQPVQPAQPTDPAQNPSAQDPSAKN